MDWLTVFSILLHHIDIDGGCVSPSAADDFQHVQDKCLEYDQSHEIHLMTLKHLHSHAAVEAAIIVSHLILT